MTPCRQGAVFCTKYVHVLAANADPTLILSHYYDHFCISSTQLWQLASGVVQVVLIRPLLHHGGEHCSSPAVPLQECVLVAYIHPCLKSCAFS